MRIAIYTVLYRAIRAHAELGRVDAASVAAVFRGRLTACFNHDVTRIQLCVFALLAGCAPAQVGEPCQHPGSCAPGAECAMVVAGVDQCVALCETPSQLCANGDLCWFTGYGGMQAGCFPGGTTAIGASCTYAPECVRGAVCAFPASGGSTGTCGRVSCDACIPRGGPCVSASECVTDTCICVGADCANDVGVCIDACTLPSGVTAGLCVDGSACVRLTDGHVGCLPAGSVPLGATCTGTPDCVRGGICDSGGHCVQACNTSADCGSGACTNGLCS